MAHKDPTRSLSPFDAPSFPRLLGSPSGPTRDMALPDEGYSDGTHSEMTDSEMAFAGSEDDMSRLLSLALRLSPDQRKSVVEKLIESLPNHDKEAIARYCASLTHFDPSQYLPNELMLSVLSYLSPRDLLACGSVSRAWRDRALDEKLWRCCFAQEGWRLDGDKINKVEAAAADFLRRQGGYEPKGKARLMDWSPDRVGKRKRKPGDAFGSVDGYTYGSSYDKDVEMDICEPENGLHAIHSLLPSMSYLSPASVDEWTARTKPSLFRPGSVEEGRPRISWPYLFKHRTRLERNWEKDGSYGMFSLPHPNHPHEGHTECVYTVQFTPLYVVSGSRDRTIRRWDLTKRRLIGQPLVGHTASVLCLQFDERPRHDMIISGGSDANVIIWRFSSGEIVRKLDRAHDESVLNLRFDDRYLVTCSKDNVVKVWNRHAIDCDDPIVPTYKLDECANIPLSLDADGRIPEFTLLAQLLGHQAAVNAVMIHDNTIISASGDRSIRAWNIKEANMVKQYSGHAKGIACVQYDGRRIVSGSSDNTIRIYDAATQSEIACLIGHSNLVRTVQARFGDLDTVTDDMLELAARRAEPSVLQLLGDSGSSKSNGALGRGAKVPPGGGGSRWARIVSGSYDEHVVIWKQDQEGRWKRNQSLTQDVFLAANFPRRSRRMAALAAGPWQAGSSSSNASGTGAQQGHMSQATPGVISAVPGPSRHGSAVASSSQIISVHTTFGHSGASSSVQPLHGQQQPQQRSVRNNTQAAARADQPRTHAVDNNRIFKLQFDARRIICCSQNRVVVGWDFANGDRDLECVGDWCLETV